jgi:hypothetical protein
MELPACETAAAYFECQHDNISNFKRINTTICGTNGHYRRKFWLCLDAIWMRN